jgi:hypothetical protein
MKPNPHFRLLLVPILTMAVSCANHQQTEQAASIASSTVVPLLTKQYRAGTVSGRAAEWLYRCINGDWDWSQFGGGPKDAPANPVVRNKLVLDARKILKPYGVPKSMRFVDQRSYLSDDGHNRTAYRFRVTLSHGTLMYIFAVDADGNVGGMLISTKDDSFTFWRSG